MIDISTNALAVLDIFRARVDRVPRSNAEIVERATRILEREVTSILSPHRKTGQMQRGIFRSFHASGDTAEGRVGVRAPQAKALEGGAFIQANQAGKLAIPIIKGLPRASAVRSTPLLYGYRYTFVKGSVVLGVPLIGRPEALYALVPWVRIKAIRYMQRARRRSLRQFKQLIKASAVRVLRGEAV